jgi:hypothetical protein
MIRTKRAIYAVSLALSLMVATLVAATPAWAASWTWYYSGGRPVSMGLYHTGNHVAKATVEMGGASVPTTLTVRYEGHHANGTATGPQKSYTWTCWQIVCAHTWTINFTYVSGNFVDGYAIVSGVDEGTASHGY